jgi:hypothetical protein
MRVIALARRDITSAAKGMSEATLSKQNRYFVCVFNNIKTIQHITMMYLLNFHFRFFVRTITKLSYANNPRISHKSKALSKQRKNAFASAPSQHFQNHHNHHRHPLPQ